MATFEKTFEIRWADLDPNRHLRHSAYADYGTHVRFQYLAESGFDRARFEGLAIGPVVFREETRYRREVTADQLVTLDFRTGGLAPDGSRWIVRHDVRLQDGKLAAELSLEGGWLDLRERKLTVPPVELRDLLAGLPRAPDWRELRALGA